MPTSTHTTPGDYIATELIAAKSRGESFKHPQLAAFVDVCLEQWTQANGFTLAGPETTIPAPQKPELNPAEAIYAAYPRKVGKTAAIKAIKAALQAMDKEHSTRSQSIHLTLLTITQQYAAAVAKWPARDRQFIPHASTWFNRGSYNDDPKEWQRGESAPSTATRDYTRL